MNRRSFLKLGALASAAAALGVRPSKATVPEVPTLPPAESLEMMAVDAEFPACFTWGSIPIHTDVDCPPDAIYFVNLSAIRRLPDGLFEIEPGTERQFGVINL